MQFLQTSELKFGSVRRTCNAFEGNELLHSLRIEQAYLHVGFQWYFFDVETHFLEFT